MGCIAGQVMDKSELALEVEMKTGTHTCKS
jgi:hypothetical protein